MTTDNAMIQTNEHTATMPQPTIIKPPTGAQRRAAIVREARRYIGCPFRLHGREARTGIDCAWLIVTSARACGYPCTGLDEMFTVRGNARQLYGAMIHRAFERVPKAEARAGDVLLLTSKPGTAHIALMSERTPQTIIHAIGHPYMKVVEQPYRMPLARAVFGCQAVTWESITAEVFRFRDVD
jgi:cell wall-associated NlpC family hydrolase